MVAPGGFVPERGDLIWLKFDPQAGREQAGRRPAFVLSPATYNSRARLCLLCPITSKVKGYPFEVALPAGLPISGVVLSDHIKNLDYSARDAQFICAAPPAVLIEVLAKLRPLLGTT